MNYLNKVKIPTLYLLAGFVITALFVITFYFILYFKPISKKIGDTLKVNNPFSYINPTKKESERCDKNNYYENKLRKYSFCYPKSWHGNFYDESVLTQGSGIQSIYSFDPTKNDNTSTKQNTKPKVTLKIDVLVKNSSLTNDFKEKKLATNVRIANYPTYEVKIDSNEVSSFYYIYYIIVKDTAYVFNVYPSAYRFEGDIQKSEAWREFIKIVSSFKLLN